MEGKIAYEKFCQEHGITIQHYHADNGIFTSNTWRQSCLQQGLVAHYPENYRVIHITG